jgi:exosortase H (IPTLxxWG-CTERM-specific)
MTMPVRRRPGMARFSLLFVAMLAVLFAAELTAPIQRILVVPWTEALARGTAALVRTFDPGVTSFGRVLTSSRNGFAISIESGCNGVEAALILVCAMLAFPAPWRLRGIGIAAGLAAVQVLNVVRLVSLFYLGQWDRAAFEWAHLYLWQGLIMLDVLLVWLVWMSAVRRRQASPHAA